MTGLALVEEDTMHESAKQGSNEPAGTTNDVTERPLTGWQAIASHLGQSISWAQRAHRWHGLPVGQPGKRGTVFAFASRLNAWLEASGAAPAAPTTSASTTAPTERPDTRRAPALRLATGSD